MASKDILQLFPPKPKMPEGVRYQTTLAPRLKQIFQVLAPILSEAVLLFDEKKVAIYGQTEEVTILVDMPISAAESYQSFGKPLHLGVDLRCIAGWLKGVTRGDIIAFSVEKAGVDADKPVLVLTQWNDDQTQVIKIDVTNATPSKFDVVPDGTTVSVCAQMKSDAFDDLVKRHASVGAAVDVMVEVIADTRRVKISTASGSISRAAERMAVQYLPSGSQTTTGSFPSKSLRAACKAHAISELVQIYMTQDGLILRYVTGANCAVTFNFKAIVEKDEDEYSPVRPAAEEIEEGEVVVVEKTKPTAKKRAAEMPDTKTKVSPAKKAKLERTVSTYSLEDLKKSLAGEKKKEVPMPPPKKKLKKLGGELVRASQKCYECSESLLGGEKVGLDDDGNLIHAKCAPVE